MILNIKGIDKLKLFLRLYNHIQAKTSFGNAEAVLKNEEAARALLATANNDYARFNIYCDLKKDEVDSNTFNALYGDGQAVFDDIVAELRKEFPLSKAPTSASLELKDKLEGLGGVPTHQPPAPQKPATGLGLGQTSNALAASSALPGSVGTYFQNWDRIGKLKDGQVVYFKQQANSGSSFLNPTAGSCGFISLGTTREEVLKILTQTSHPQAQKLIIEQIESELLNSNSFFAFGNDRAIMDNLKSLQRAASAAQQDIVNLQAQLKTKYWAYTAAVRPATATEPAKWYITPSDFQKIMQGLYTKPSTGLKEFEVLMDVLKLTDAIEHSQKSTKAYEEMLCSPKVMQAYLQKCITTEWMGANIALAWALSTKRTLRIWKHENVRSKSEEIFVFRDTTEDLLAEDSNFKDQAPIDIVHTPILMGALENHYEKLVKIDAPIQGLKISTLGTAPVLFSNGLASSTSKSAAPLIVPAPQFPGTPWRINSYST